VHGGGRRKDEAHHSKSPALPVVAIGRANARAADDAMRHARYTRRMFQPRRIKHCRVCGSPVAYRKPADDNRDRAVCDTCGEIHYENPINVVGTLPVWGDQVLLCRRNIEPRKGFWTLPAGFLELGESTAEGASRETDEEAGARIELGPLFTILNVVRAGQVHFFYLARMLDTHASHPAPRRSRRSSSREARTSPGPRSPSGPCGRRSSTTFADRRSRALRQVHAGDIS
jgi:ADP-ribose pyrophosphatase YjhB (NUDIX family)